MPHGSAALRHRSRTGELRIQAKLSQQNSQNFRDSRKYLDTVQVVREHPRGHRETGSSQSEIKELVVKIFFECLSYKTLALISPILCYS
ncbi:hypothetical protein Nmel_015349 [Mimus melanotis]